MSTNGDKLGQSPNLSNADNAAGSAGRIDPLAAEELQRRVEEVRAAERKLEAAKASMREFRVAAGLERGVEQSPSRHNNNDGGSEARQTLGAAAGGTVSAVSGAPSGAGTGSPPQKKKVSLPALPLDRSPVKSLNKANMTALRDLLNGANLSQHEPEKAIELYMSIGQLVGSGGLSTTEFASVLHSVTEPSAQLCLGLLPRLGALDPFKPTDVTDWCAQFEARYFGTVQLNQLTQRFMALRRDKGESAALFLRRASALYSAVLITGALPTERALLQLWSVEALGLDYVHANDFFFRTTRTDVENGSFQALEHLRRLPSAMPRWSS